MRKDEFTELQNQLKEQAQQLKTVSAGETNDRLKELIAEEKKEIEAIEAQLAPFKKAKTKVVT